MRKVDRLWYRRGTDGLTKEVEKRLRAAGVRGSIGKTPNEARVRWERHISPALITAMPDGDMAGTVEELLRQYEADDLPTKKRQATQDEYRGRVGRLREDFGDVRSAKTADQALITGCLSEVIIIRHLHENRHRASSANKDIQTLSRTFRLARIRWGLTTFNPCEAIGYLPEAPRDQCVSEMKYAEIYEAAPPALQYMLEISLQTGARIRLGGQPAQGPSSVPLPSAVKGRNAA